MFTTPDPSGIAISVDDDNEIVEYGDNGADMSTTIDARQQAMDRLHKRNRNITMNHGHAAFHDHQNQQEQQATHELQSANPVMPQQTPGSALMPLFREANTA